MNRVKEPVRETTNQSTPDRADDGGPGLRMFAYRGTRLLRGVEEGLDISTLTTVVLCADLVPTVLTDKLRDILHEIFALHVSLFFPSGFSEARLAFSVFPSPDPSF